MAKGLQKRTAGSGIAAEGLDDIIFGLRGLEQAGEVKKEFRAFHKSLSKEVELATRAEALRQKEQGFAVPKRTRGSAGYVGGGTDRTAFLDIRKTNKFVRNLEFGRKYQFIPNLTAGSGGNRKPGFATNELSKTQRGNVGRGFIDEQGKQRIKNIGVFFPAEKMRKRVYKEWVGDFWTERGGFPEGTRVGGYVAEKTIARIVPGLSAEYADEMFKLVKKVMKDK